MGSYRPSPSTSTKKMTNQPRFKSVTAPPFGGFLVRILVLVHQVGWPGEVRGSRGSATGGAALTFAPGRAVGPVFWGGGLASEIASVAGSNSVPALASVAGLMLAYADAKNGSALVIPARNHPWKSLK
jgi:hypothetical protein